MLKKLNEKNLPAACRRLAERDAGLAFVFDAYGVPPLWAREPTFPTLLHIILEQQVSLASALSAFNKSKEKLGAITPAGILSLTDAEMKACYFSCQKTVYARELAKAILDESLNLESFENLSNEQIKIELKKIKGIGDWTADIYLLMAMLRPDVMPKGDLALHAAWQKLKNLERRPAADEFLQIAERWKPLRSVAARLLWHFYLSSRKNLATEDTEKNREKSSVGGHG